MDRELFLSVQQFIEYEVDQQVPGQETHSSLQDTFFRVPQNMGVTGNV